MSTGARVLSLNQHAKTKRETKRNSKFVQWNQRSSMKYSFSNENDPESPTANEKANAYNNWFHVHLPVGIRQFGRGNLNKSEEEKWSLWWDETEFSVYEHFKMETSWCLLTMLNVFRYNLIAVCRVSVIIAISNDNKLQVYAFEYYNEERKKNKKREEYSTNGKRRNNQMDLVKLNEFSWCSYKHYDDK